MSPETRAVMELMEVALPRPEAGGMTVIEAREQIAKNVAAAAIEPLPVAHVEDRGVSGPAGDIPVRVYRPGDDAPYPGVVYFHGGGWTICSLDTHDHTCRRMAMEAGCTVVSVDYRLAPEHKFPAAADDAWSSPGPPTRTFEPSSPVTRITAIGRPCASDPPAPINTGCLELVHQPAI